jgi:hypothetical protein
MAVEQVADSVSPQWLVDSSEVICCSSMSAQLVITDPVASQIERWPSM